MCGEAGLSQTLIQTSSYARVAGRGDMDGDGLPDIAVGMPASPDPSTPEVPGRVVVVSGPAAHEALDLGEDASLTIIGEQPRDRAGAEIAGVGDVNGDGLEDLLVAADRSCVNLDPDCFEGDCPIVCSPGPSRAYLVHGKEGGGVIALADVAAGVGGLAIDHPESSTLDDQRFAALDDLNGDGLADFAIAAPSGASYAGEVYVVFGREGGEPVDLSAVAAGTGGFVIRAEGVTDRLGDALSAAGDVNGDGLTDLVIGAPAADDNKGRAYVVFGKASTAPVLLVDVAAGKGGGFALVGEDNYPVPAGAETGLTVAPAGDIDGDGLADVAVGAPFLSLGEGPTAGRAYIVLGKADAAPVQLEGLKAGVIIDGVYEVGFWLIGDGTDLDGDGAPDLFVGNADAELARVSGAPIGGTVVMGDAHAPILALEQGWYLNEVVGDLDCDGRSELAEINIGLDDTGVLRLDLDFGG